MASIAFTDISKDFGTTPILRKLSLSIASGEFLTILGPSGCGKSTLLRILAGLETQTSGSVAIDGTIVDGLRPKQRNVAMVFQSYALYPHMTVGANMALPLTMRRLSVAQRLPLLGSAWPGTGRTLAGIRADVARVAATLSIDHLLDRKPGQLSGGQRQRVALGRAMVREPAVFLMDEPLSNLDAKLRVQMRAEIKDLHQRLGATFVYVTHDQSEAMTMSHRVAVMAEGELLQVAPPQQIYFEPSDRRVAEFIGAPKINLLDTKVGEHGAVSVAGVTLVARSGADCGSTLTLGLRPEAFHLSKKPRPGTIPGRIRLIEPMGADLFVHVEWAGVAAPLIARLPAAAAGDMVSGAVAHLAIDENSILLFGKDGRRIGHGSRTPTVPVRSKEAV